MNGRAKALAVSVALLFVASVTAAQSTNGPEFQVNTYTTGTQWRPKVAADGTGHFVVVWTGRGNGDHSAVFGRRYLSSGAPLGADFRVNSYTTDRANNPSPTVGADREGRFTVVWTDGNRQPENSATRLLAQRFGPTGMPLGTEFRVDTPAFGTFKFQPSMATNVDGSFVVVWVQLFSDYPYGVYHVMGRRFDSSGTPQGPDFTATIDHGFPSNARYQSYPQVAFTSGGAFIVAWVGSFGPTTSCLTCDVVARRFDPAGSPVGDEFLLDPSDDLQSSLSLAGRPSGAFVATWHEQATSDLPTDVRARLFNADAVPEGPAFTVNSYTTGQQRSPSIAVAATGNFLVVWANEPDDGTWELQGRQFDANGTPLGGEIRVNTDSYLGLIGSNIAATGPGDFVVVWSGYRQGESSADVFGRRYGDRVFTDGFNWNMGGP